jgi:hypothetical protein
MFKRAAPLTAPLLLLLLLAACGTPSATPTGTTGGNNSAAPPASSSPAGTPVPAPSAPATPTLPAGQKPPRPVPDPAAVAAGAPLRATLLAQIDDYASEVAKCQRVGTPIVSCNLTGFEAVRPHSPELAAYMSWYSFIQQCSSDGKGGYIATMMYIYSPPDELRDPGLLDIYVSGTPWCGQTRPDASPAATPSALPSARPATPSATPATPAGQRVSPQPAAPATSVAPDLPVAPTTQTITQVATAKSITSDNRPAERATEFAAGDTVYITYTVANAGPGDFLDVQLYRNGQALALQDTRTTFDKGTSYHGYYSYRPTEAGEYRVEFSFNGQPVPGQVATFTVR